MLTFIEEFAFVEQTFRVFLPCQGTMSYHGQAMMVAMFYPSFHLFYSLHRIFLFQRPEFTYDPRDVKGTASAKFARIC